MLVADAFKAADPLTEVSFVHDYVQLSFQDLGLSVYSQLTVGTPRGLLKRSDSGFCDALVGLIGQRVTSVEYSAKISMRLIFSDGSSVNVSLRSEDANGSELFQLKRLGLPIIVAQVA